MKPEDIAETVASSADAVYDYLEFMQYATDPPLGVSVTEVSGCTVSGNYAVLKLDSALGDSSNLSLLVDSLWIKEDAAGFTRYDEVSKTIVVRPGSEVLERMADPSVKIRLVSDMKFLIIALRDFYRRYGKMLTLPIVDPVFAEPSFPAGSSPTANQREAVDTVLRSRLSYVWGAPGTGKTQFVLATCIRACLEAGQKVAVFAPTNNSVEQVLRGIIKSFSDDSSILDGIIRLGVPTKEFLKEHPGMCEDSQADRRMQQCLESADNLMEVMLERCCDELESEVLELQRDIDGLKADSSGRVMLRDHRRIADRFGELKEMFAAFPGSRDLVSEADSKDIRDVMHGIVDALYGRDRPASEIEEFDSWSDADLMGAMLQFELDAEGFRKRSVEARIGDATIIASTPQQFIARFRPRGSEEDKRMELDVDRIFLDEAGYCGLLQAASLFTNGVPVTFLGDHMQLPPVSVLDSQLLEDAALKNGSLKDAYLWNMSALYCEQLVDAGPGSVRASFLGSLPPELILTRRADLTESHRFGSNLASILDRYVYRNGITGVSGSDLDIGCIDATCTERNGRENRGEAYAIRDYLKQNPLDPDKVVVLTPYTVQLRLLKRVLGRRYRDSVMTVHGSQGREWDTVIFSVADNGVESRDVPFRFTSSSTDIGIKVINTAVSRAKKMLLIACDRDFWLSKDDELISGLLRAVPEGNVITPRASRERGS